MIDGSQIKLSLLCSNTLNSSIAAIPSTTAIPSNEEEIHWLIKNEECNSEPREYAGIITKQLSSSSTTIDAYYDIPILSNHSSNITTQISGSEPHGFGIGSHKITYAADSTKYFIMCQITIYVIGMSVLILCFYKLFLCNIIKGDVSAEDLMQCTNLDDGKIGIINLIVDRDTFLAIDADEYEYEDATDPIQVSYINPDIKAKHIQCFININWANIGDPILYSSMTDLHSSSDSMMLWKILIVLCIILLLALICERMYFYHHRYKKQYYSLNDEDDAELSLS